MGELIDYQLCVNGREHDVADSWLGESLLYVLRERLGLPGSKNACEQGECGSCSVLMDGKVVCSCMVLAASAVGVDIVTVEGLSAGENDLSDVQAAFLAEGGVQCGFCTPGVILTAYGLAQRMPRPTREEIRYELGGSLCRCTGYTKILDAVESYLENRAFASEEARS